MTDIEQLRQALADQGTALVYVPEITSTMDLAAEQGMTASVVLTDHQTKGRGRYDRTWKDTPGSSILATFVRALPKTALPPTGSLLLSHCFVLAIHEALGSPQIQIKWPNDLMIDGRKLGGVLLAEGASDEDRQSILFGAGINLRSNDRDEASSLEEVVSNPDRGELVPKISRTLDLFLADIGHIDDPAVRSHYDALWSQASFLLGKHIRIESEGAPAIEGTVISMPFGGFLQLSLSDGTIIDVKEYGRTAHIEVLRS